MTTYLDEAFEEAQEYLPYSTWDKGAYKYWTPVVDIVNGWTWESLIAASPFPVEQERFPLENSGVKLGGAKIPCTDGGTIFVHRDPWSQLEYAAGYLFHEMAHCLLHYPGGPDPDLLDPLPRSVSIYEAEACITASRVMTALGFGHTHYNTTFLDGWRGVWGNIDLEKCGIVADSIIARYNREKTEDK